MVGEGGDLDPRQVGSSEPGLLHRTNLHEWGGGSVRRMRCGCSALRARGATKNGPWMCHTLRLPPHPRPLWPVPTPSSLGQVLHCFVWRAEYLVLKFEARLGELCHGKLPGRVPTVGSRLGQVLAGVPQLQEIRESMDDHPASVACRGL